MQQASERASSKERESGKSGQRDRQTETHREKERERECWVQQHDKLPVKNSDKPGKHVAAFQSLAKNRSISPDLFFFFFKSEREGEGITEREAKH